MLVIVGLGNPGAKYRNTRHNVGFMLLDRIAGGELIQDASLSKRGYDEFKRLGMTSSQGRPGRIAVELEGSLDGKGFILVKPATYMNESGKAVASLLTRRILHELSELLVIVDDVDLEIGRIRLREKGSTGGHNGLRSIIRHLGTDEFARLRIGVGPRPGGDEMVDHVLGSFMPEEIDGLGPALDKASQVVASWITGQFEGAQNTYSRITNT